MDTKEKSPFRQRTDEAHELALIFAKIYINRKRNVEASKANRKTNRSLA